MTKQKKTRFQADTEKYLAGIGAQFQLGRTYEWTLGTSIGRLEISPQDDWIACRWEDADRARAAGLACNPYSGKWNFHVCSYPPLKPAAVLALFQAELNPFCCRKTHP